jgi:hypothetical protein
VAVVEVNQSERFKFAVREPRHQVIPGPLRRVWLCAFPDTQRQRLDGERAVLRSAGTGKVRSPLPFQCAGRAQIDSRQSRYRSTRWQRAHLGGNLVPMRFPIFVAYYPSLSSNREASL